jgi:2-oxoisovalerate dehydrogenase E2 component (dihydrolipoyl transacylase)
MANTTRVTMPQLGESVHEGTISKWLVQPGDHIEEFEPLLEVDTDKVNAEVPSPVTGVLQEILAHEGDTIEAGSEIAVVEVDGDGAGTPAAGTTPAQSTEAAPRAGSAEAGAVTSRQQDTPQVAPAAPGGSGGGPRADGGGKGGPNRYSPAVLMLAEENDVDLSQLEGTGVGGRVTKRDVRRFLEGRGAAATARPTAAPAAPAPAAPQAAPSAAAAPSEPAAAPGAGDEAVPLSRVRRLIAQNMTTSKTTIPHAWQTQEVDMSGVAASRNAHKREFQEREGFSLTYLPYVVAAGVAALREHPHVNATFNGDELLVHRGLNVGISVGLDDTLVVPVIKGADGLSLAGLARAINDLATRARTKKLSADDLAGGTFTVNNSGTFGTLFSYSVINPGQAGILTMEAIQDRPVAIDGMLAIRPMMYLCFSFDHRVLDGLQAARFLVSARQWLASVSADTPIY